MAKPQKPIPYILPSFEVEKVVPTLEKDGKIYARLITARNRMKEIFSLRERKGIEAEKYVGKPLECVVEIVKAQFFDPETSKKDLPKNVIKGTFVGWDTGYKFFSQLVSMVDGETGSADDEDFDEDEYDELAIELFAKWGVYGFGLDVYRDKPMIKTEDEVYFLNEFIFEEQINEWENNIIPNVPVCFVIEELLLHGIKPFEGKWKKGKEEKEIIARPNEMIIRGRPRIVDPG